MNSKLCKILRKQAYPMGYTRAVYYETNINRERVCIQERGKYRALKKAYKHLKRLGK